MGKIPEGPVSKCSETCVGPECYGALKVNTLWEKEVLLIRGTYPIPPLKDGHRYRVRVNHRGHVGNGGGFGIYINGRKLIENDGCIGRNGGKKAYGAFITQEFLDEFKGGEVTIAVKSFLRDDDTRKGLPKKRVPQGLISIQLDEQKMPPMGDDLVRQSAKLEAMTTSEWETAVKSDEGSNEDDPDSFKFRWDGNWKPNAKVMGDLQITEFDPSKKYSTKRAFTKRLHLKKDAATDDPIMLWSGDHLMNLKKYEAHKMIVRNIAGVDYLFIETGNFRKKTRSKSEPLWVVFARTK
jgi:hypothetical protein